MAEYVLVTGGAGYIGSHIAKSLKLHGFIPVVLDNLVSGHKEFVRWGPSLIGHVNDRTLLRTILTHYRPSAVIHCAAHTEVDESTRNPAKYYHNNAFSSLVLLEEMVRCNIHKLIFSSTCSIYGAGSTSLFSEDHPLLPTSPYGNSKKMTEQIIDDFANAYPLSYIILRFFNVAGADRDGELGESRDKETHLIPLLLEVVAGRRKEISIYGTDYPTEDGSAVRDFVHVSDIAQGHIQALTQLQKSTKWKINLGSGQGTSVKQMIHLVEETLETTIRTVEKKRRSGDMPYMVANIEKAQTLLEWRPTYNMQEIIQSAWNWKRKTYERF